MPRLYREAPLMGIWEGSGNVSALDTLRAMATRPECVEVLFDELADGTGQDPRLASHVDAAARTAGRPGDHPVPRPARSPRTSAWRCRARCWCATAIPPSPRRSWPPGSAASGAARSAPCPTGWISRRSWSGRWSRAEPQHDSRDQAGRLRQPENDDLRGHRPGCANHVQPAGKGQRDRRRHPAGAVGAGGARRPRPECARHPGVRPRRGLLRGLRPERLRRRHRLGRRHRRLPGHRAGRKDPGGQPSAGSAVGPDDRLPDDEPLRARASPA